MEEATNKFVCGIKRRSVHGLYMWVGQSFSKLFIFLRPNFSIWNSANDNPNFH